MSEYAWPYSEYEKAYLEYKNQYGEKTAVFMKMGSFIEMYDSIDPKTNVSACNCREITECMEIRPLITKGAGPEGRDAFLAGVPKISGIKYYWKLIDNGWTIIIVDTIKDENSMRRCGRGWRLNLPSAESLICGGKT
jgi:hypothetical protein